LNAQFVASHDAARWMNDDGVAGGGMFRIEWFLYAERASMFPAHQPGGITIALEPEVKRRQPVAATRRQALAVCRRDG